MSQIVEIVENGIAKQMEELGYEIVDVTYESKYDAMNLTIFIDKTGGVTLDDCEVVHRAIDPILDELNPTGDAPYVLNVSSPGLDRPFKKQRDFERNYGNEVEVKLFAPLKGKKNYAGILKEKKEHVVIIEVDGNLLSLENSKVVYVRPLVKFD